ncbi:small ribosomal subunit protein bS18m-like [Dugong dugon]
MCLCAHTHILKTSQNELVLAPALGQAIDKLILANILMDFQMMSFQWAREVEGQVLWRRACSQYKQATSNEDLPIPMENPYKEPLKKCLLCGKRVDYKNVQLLSQFISPFTGCIYGRHITGLCGKKQKEITKVIKRAQIMGFMPVTSKDPAYLKDPKVCNIKYWE